MLDSNKVKKKLTVEDIIKLCTHLQGSDEFFYDSYGNPIFSTILDHPDSSGSFKEYYFPETKLFRCFTRGESYDVFELVSYKTNFFVWNTFPYCFDDDYA